MPYLAIAEKDYAALEMLRALQDVQFFISVIYHNLDRTEERDAAATRHQETEQKRLDAEKTASEPWIAEVLDVVSEVSVALAAR